MEHKTILTHHLNLVKGRHIQNLVEINTETFLAISGWIESPSWNHVIVNNPSILDEILLSKITQICKLSGRLPAIYIIESLFETKEFIFGFGYKLFDTEYWMTISPNNLLQKENSAIGIQSIKTEAEIEIFIRTFKLAFNSLEFAYAYQLYLSLVDKNNLSNKAFHVYAIYNGVPVGIGSCYYNNQYAGIYNLAVIPDYQGRGIGSFLISALAKHIDLQGCKTIFLQAEITSKSFYEKLGFTHSFTGQIFTKL